MPKKLNRQSRSAPRGASDSRPARRARPEVLVIGSGAVGAACASALARRGLRVRVLSHPTRSTTSISGGQLLLQSKRPGPVLELTRRSLELVAEFARGEEEALGYRNSGSLLLAVTEAEAEALRAHAQAQMDAGIPIELLDGDTARRLEPELSPHIIAASYCPLDAQVDPRALAGAWLHDALRSGAVMTSGVIVEGFITTGAAITGVVAGQVEYPASAVVVAAGVWSGELASMAGLPIEIRPRRGVLLRTVTDRVLTSRPLLSGEYLLAKQGADPASVTFGFQQHPSGECVFGGTRDFAGFEPGDVEAAGAAILECGARYLPAVREVPWTQRDVGYRPWTSGEPYIGRTRVPGLYLACGHEGEGITLAAGTAELVTDAVAQDTAG
jgi:glycine/D-amino acid oxidase-like deaminating enzyme